MTVVVDNPSPTDVLAVMKQLYCVNGLSPVIEAISVIPFTTDLMVGTFDPITCSGYVWCDEVLQ